MQPAATGSRFRFDGGCSCESLIKLVAAGHAPSFEALYLQQIVGVRRLAASIVRDVSQADEVAQEVMVEIWQQAGAFDPDRGTGWAWITRITRCRAIDRIRSVQRSRDREQSYFLEAGGLVVDDVVKVVWAGLDASMIRRALLQLSVQQREALVLAFYSASSYPQIADQLEIPLGTLKSRIRDGLIKLRRILHTEGFLMIENPVAA